MGKEAYLGWLQRYVTSPKPDSGSPIVPIAQIAPWRGGCAKIGGLLAFLHRPFIWRAPGLWCTCANSPLPNFTLEEEAKYRKVGQGQVHLGRSMFSGAYQWEKSVDIRAAVWVKYCDGHVIILPAQLWVQIDGHLTLRCLVYSYFILIALLCFVEHWAMHNMTSLKTTGWLVGLPHHTPWLLYYSQVSLSRRHVHCNSGPVGNTATAWVLAVNYNYIPADIHFLCSLIPIFSCPSSSKPTPKITPSSRHITPSSCHGYGLRAIQTYLPDLHTSYLTYLVGSTYPHDLPSWPTYLEYLTGRVFFKIGQVRVGYWKKVE